MQARLNERLAKLRTDMRLKPEQVPLFETVEGVIKKRAEERRSGWSAMREQRETFRHADIMEKLDMMSGRASERAARSKELADAVRPLWVTLSDEQKTVARRAVREAMAEGRGRMRAMHERMHGGMEDRMEGYRGGRGYHDGERGRAGARIAATTATAAADPARDATDQGRLARAAPFSWPAPGLRCRPNR